MADAWNDYYTEENLKKIQKIELCSLDVLEEICKKLNIRFFLYGGSLLGAIKYQGFVPWDDDLDIAMLRADYEKFIREGPKLLPENYEIQHPKTNKRTPYHYIKFRRTDTALVEYRNHKIKMNHGVYFDIYPIAKAVFKVADLRGRKLHIKYGERDLLISAKLGNLLHLSATDDRGRIKGGLYLQYACRLLSACRIQKARKLVKALFARAYITCGACNADEDGSFIFNRSFHTFPFQK